MRWGGENRAFAHFVLVLVVVLVLEWTAMLGRTTVKKQMLVAKIG
jgi:hypothetical protein